MELHHQPATTHIATAGECVAVITRGILSGATMVTTTKDDSIGLYADGGGVIDGSKAASVTVTTSGTDAIGVYASGTAPPSEPGGPPGPASSIVIGGVATITTNGATAAGVQADLGGQVMLNGGSVATPNTVTTVGDGSIGLYALTGGTIDVNGPTTIKTGSILDMTGADAYGVYANGVSTSGVSSQVNLNAATMVTTYGTGVYGMDAYG